MADYIIHDSTPEDETHDVVVNGEVKGRGGVPRDYSTHQLGCYASAYAAVDMPLIPRSEWSARIKEMAETRSRISDLRNVGNNGQRIPSLNQGQSNFCWGHSTTQAIIMRRMAAGLPYVPLSAFAVACVIKNFRNEGGWGALSLDFISRRGVPSQQFWPQGSMARSNDNPETWANAALHKATESWLDLGAAVYDRTLTFDQMMTLLLCRVPVVIDLNWWSHSVLAIDPVEIEANSFGPRILNSWSDAWGENGTGVLQGQKGAPDGAVAPRDTTASTL